MYFPIKRGVIQRVVGQVHAVDDVSFEVYKGETLGLVGESGCGKTTTGRTILKLYEPSGGNVVFEGKDLVSLHGEEMRVMRRKIQMIFQDPYASLNPRMTVEQIIGEPLVVHGLARGHEIREKVKDLLALVGLNPAYVDRYPHEFSGGQRQRIGVARAIALQPDLIVCDVIMPEMDGREFLRQLRTAKVTIPVIMLTQVGTTYEKILTLEEGADDYINKPFDPMELVARINAVLRRSRLYQPSLTNAWMIAAGDLIVNRQRREAYYQGELLRLTRRAFILLEYLVTHPDEILSRERLLEIVWGWENVVDTRAVDSRIVELRKALKDQTGEPRYIETIPQQGYRFIHPVKISG